MKISKDKQGNFILKFTSNINIDNGYTLSSQGSHDSEMTLYLDELENPVGIEWDNPVELTYIGIEFDELTMEVTGYDGLFDLSSQAVYLLEQCGFKISADLLESIHT